MICLCKLRFSLFY